MRLNQLDDKIVMYCKFYNFLRNFISAIEDGFITC